MRLPFYLLLWLLVLPSGAAKAQKLYRIKASFEIRERSSLSDTISMVKGTAYYDKYSNRVVYDISFPRSEKWVIIDTFFAVYRNDSLEFKGSLGFINSFSMFNLILTGRLSTFGLENTAFRLRSMEKSDSGTLQHWEYPDNMPVSLGRIVLLNDKGKMKSTAIFDPGNKEVIQKLYFSDYRQYGRLDIPCEIIEISYLENAKQYRITRFTEVAVDEKGSDHLYRYPAGVQR